MALYSVHNRRGASPDEAIFVPEGFSTGALVFTVLWALWHRMWLVAAVLLAVMVAIALAGNYFGLGEWVTALASFVVSLLFGFEARDLQRRSLIAAGYSQIGFSHGRDLDDAEIRYYHTRATPPAPTTQVMAQPVPRLQAPDTLGIFGNL
jgi:hypothetical protein